MKAVCFVAFLSVSLGASAGSQPVATDATGMSGMQAESEQSDQCQSGSLIQRSSQKAMLPTKATLGETEVAEPETPPNKVSKKMNNKMNKKMQKRQKMQKEHGDLLAFLAQSKESKEQIPPGDSECTPTGAPLAGESKAKFEVLLQKVSALDLDAVIARLVKKKDYMPKIAKRAADEYRKFLVLMGMGEKPVAPKMVVDAWQAHIMFTQTYERDCREVFGHLLEHDPLAQHLEASRLEQMQQQICDYFGMVDRLVWEQPRAVAALSQSADPATTMQHWLDHINDKSIFREDLMTEDVHVLLVSQHSSNATTYDGRIEALSFFHQHGHATRAREFISVTPGAFAIEMTKNLRMGVDIFEVNSQGQIFDIKIWMASLRADQDDLNDTGLTTFGNGSQALVDAGETDVTLTKAAMESWMQSLNAEPKEELLAADVRMLRMSQRDMEPEIHTGKAEVMDFFRDFEHASGAREFLSVDGGAFMLELKNDMHPRMGILVFEVNPDGKIQDIKVWMGSLENDKADLGDSGLNQTLLSQEEALVASPEPTECLRSGSQPSPQQTRSFKTTAKKVKTLDLNAVVAVLEKDGYSPSRAASLAEEYRKYLTLVGAGLNPVPSQKVDDVWHAHILNTKKYQADTRALFGHVLHHEPANLLLDQQGMTAQKSSMDDMFLQTKMQLCDFYGRVNEAVWSKEDVALCVCACGCGCSCACGCGCGCVTPSPPPSPSPSPSSGC